MCWTFRIQGCLATQSGRKPAYHHSRCLERLVGPLRPRAVGHAGGLRRGSRAGLGLVGMASGAGAVLPAQPGTSSHRGSGASGASLDPGDPKRRWSASAGRTSGRARAPRQSASTILPRLRASPCAIGKHLGSPVGGISAHPAAVRVMRWTRPPRGRLVRRNLTR
jgi:hypothetical protein